MGQAEIGIIGGSGLYAMPGLSKIKQVRLTTPFGAPSDAYVCGTLEDREVAFLARHARGHRILPSELNFRSTWGPRVGLSLADWRCGTANG